MSRFELSDDAKIDLNEIWDYIASDSIPSADRVLANIYDVLIKLTDIPLQLRSIHQASHAAKSQIRKSSEGDTVHV